MACFCQIIPDEVLKRFSNDPRLTAEQRRHFANAARIGTEIRKLRKQAGKLTAVTASMGLVAGVVPATPAITLSDCQHNQTLPGIPVADPDQFRRRYDKTRICRNERRSRILQIRVRPQFD